MRHGRVAAPSSRGVGGKAAPFQPRENLFRSRGHLFASPRALFRSQYPTPGSRSGYGVLGPCWDAASPCPCTALKKLD